MKKSLLFLSSLLLFLSSYLSRADFFYACEGVNLWFHTILPSLLPFLILTSLLLETGAARRISARAEVFSNGFRSFPGWVLCTFSRSFLRFSHGSAHHCPAL